MFTTLTIENKELRWKISNVNEQYDVSGSDASTSLQFNMTTLIFS